jgi:hypothetical protein
MDDINATVIMGTAHAFCGVKKRVATSEEIRFSEKVLRKWDLNGRKNGNREVIIESHDIRERRYSYLRSIN